MRTGLMVSQTRSFTSAYYSTRPASADFIDALKEGSLDDGNRKIRADMQVMDDSALRCF